MTEKRRQIYEQGSQDCPSQVSGYRCTFLQLSFIDMIPSLGRFFLHQKEQFKWISKTKEVFTQCQLVVCRCSFSSIRFSKANWIFISGLYSFYYHVKCYCLKLLTSSNVMTHLFLFKSPCPLIYQLVSSRTARIAEDIPLFYLKKGICYFFIHVTFYF